jgi:SAM-dependent methyltransferase
MLPIHLMTENKMATVTRGNGLLEGFLARQRASMADRLIPDAARSGRILDIGCGSFPLFLQTVRFAEKYGMDKMASSDALRFSGGGISIAHRDIAEDQQLPYSDGFFDVITMLAVFEHIEPAHHPCILKEIYRTLRREGYFVMTTPAPWTDRILRLLASWNMVSGEEIEEHKGAYSHRIIADLLEKGGFDRSGMCFGSFEAGMNLWASARKF